MAATPGIDMELLHWHLWETKTPKGFVELTQQELADRLCVSRGRVSQVIARMESQGRLTPTKTRGRYDIADPEGFKPKV